MDGHHSAPRNESSSRETTAEIFRSDEPWAMATLESHGATAEWTRDTFFNPRSGELPKVYPKIYQVGFLKYPFLLEEAKNCLLLPIICLPIFVRSISTATGF